MNKSIADAIAKKRLIRFFYDGFEPHTYGIHKKANRTLVAYQVKGGSQSGEYVGWKTFHETEMRNLTILEAAFAAPRPEYHRNDPIFALILAQL